MRICGKAVALFMSVGMAAFLVQPIAEHLALGTAPATTSNIPDHLSNREFWHLVDSFSEDEGYFPSENLVSNEIAFQDVIPRLTMNAKTDGAYLGVGPDQNFTYISALHPKIAFIVDIRRQNMLQQLMYKALFGFQQTGLISCLNCFRGPVLTSATVRRQGSCLKHSTGLRLTLKYFRQHRFQSCTISSKCTASRSRQVMKGVFATS